MHEGFPGSHSQPVVSDPSICPHSHYATLLPVVPTQPLSTVRPSYGQSSDSRGHSVWGALGHSL